MGYTWENFSASVLNFFVTGSLPKKLTMTWVMFIPKYEGAVEIKDYRPNSMVGCVYKVIAKLLVNKIRKVMGNLVEETQTAFVQDRQILDGALIACEAIQWLKNKRKSVMLLKLDFRKAYDSIRWAFIDHVLQTMGFGDTWRLWIRGCLTSADMSIMVNGSPTKPFHMERGLQQGDLLSLFLFVLVAEVLNKLLYRAGE